MIWKSPKTAEAELGLAAAQLQVVREKKPVSQDTTLQKMLLISQMREIEAKLDGVGVVRSPYEGTVKKIKWLGQVNQELTVELTISLVNLPIARSKDVP